MKVYVRAVFMMAMGMMVPGQLDAQEPGSLVEGLHGILDKLFDTMMPECQKLIAVSQGIGGIGALFYIGSRVWPRLIAGEQIDFYPLLRPFALSICIMFFPTIVLGTINGLLGPTKTATAKMVTDSDDAIKVLLARKEEAIKQTDQWKMYVGINGKGDREKWLKYIYGVDDTAPAPSEDIFSSFGNDIKFAMEKQVYNFKNSIKAWMSEILQLLFQAAALCINTLRTFNLIILALLGPLVFGLSVFDGLQHSLTGWLTRYINIFLWLPVCNIFGAIIGKIQVEMLKLDLDQLAQKGMTFFSPTDIAYMVFMIIGIVGYFTVPTVAGYIVNAGGGGAMMQKVTSLASSASKMAMSTPGKMASGAGNIASMGRYFNEGYSGKNEGSGAAGNAGAAIGKMGAFLKDKLSAKTDK